MIRVKRTGFPPPPELADDGRSAGAREREKTNEFYSDPNNEKLPYDKYAAYKKEGVLKALNQLFRGKCAYCETVHAATQPTDVEHFRPKGGVVVNGVFDRPGYYWLAATWENLLPSCIDCNRERKQEFSDGKSGKSGKANHFPLSKEERRARRPDQMKQEARIRLLLDPCTDDPDKHLRFTDDGDVEPVKSKAGRESKIGLASIQVYGLRRRALVDERAERAKEALASIKRIKQLHVRMKQFPDAGFREDLLEEMALLKGYCQPDRRYAGMVRQLVRRHYPEFDLDA